jgi:hypothetical protein
MLSDKIWITRKARIYTEQRLLSSNMVSNLLVIWYSFLLVGFTIWNLKYPDDHLNIMLVFESIGVLVASVVVISQKYIDRSIVIRNCYIKLDELYSKVKRAEEKKDIKLIEELEGEYSDTILNVENHTDYDFLSMRYSLRNNETTLPKFTFGDSALYFVLKIGRILLIILYISLPIIITIIWGLFK